MKHCNFVFLSHLAGPNPLNYHFRHPLRIQHSDPPIRYTIGRPPKTFMNDFKLDREKAINTLLYICHSQQEASCDMYTLLKIVFFADSLHLCTYGRPITGDTMCALRYGPVPRFCYDFVKPANIDHSLFNNDEQNIIEALREPVMDVFSESDIECLNLSIKKYVGLAFPELRDQSHTRAYEKIKSEKGLNKPIPYLEIAREDGKVSEEMLKYISSRTHY